MKRFVLSSIALLGLVLVALALVAISGERLDRGRVYTVAEVRAELAHDPAAWLHRTLRVRGIAVASGCAVQTPAPMSSCGPLQFGLSDAGPTASPARLPLVLVAGNPLLTDLRRLPLVGRFAPHHRRSGGRRSPSTGSTWSWTPTAAAPVTTRCWIPLPERAPRTAIR